MSHAKRRRKRIKMVLPIRVWGTDANGKAFVCLAHTLDVTPGGARVAGLNAPLQLGERIGITRGMKKAYFRVAWIGEAGSPAEEQIGVELIDTKNDIWGLQLPAAEPDDYRNRESESSPKQSSPVASAELPQSTANSLELTGFLRELSGGLQHAMDVIQESSLPPAIMEEFRSAFSQFRNTSHIVERLAGDSTEFGDSYPAAVLVNTNRVQAACSLCAALATDLPSVRSALPKHLLESLVQTVGDLFAQAANFEVVHSGPEASETEDPASEQFWKDQETPEVVQG
jgi:hypothetical protein